LILVFSTILTSSASQLKRLDPDTMEQLQRLSRPAISPDGTQAVVAVTRHGMRTASNCIHSCWGASIPSRRWWPTRRRANWLTQYAADYGASNRRHGEYRVNPEH
jgi:hypothetical protein